MADFEVQFSENDSEFSADFGDTQFVVERNHQKLDHLDFEHSGHTGFASADDVNAKYTKPASGIPKSHLAAAVKTSLEKADSAIQATDFVTNEKAGLVKASKEYATSFGGGGILASATRSKEQYNGMPNNAFISKGTLENVIMSSIIFVVDTEEDRPPAEPNNLNKICIIRTPVIEGDYAYNKIYQCRHKAETDICEWVRVYSQYKIKAADGSAFVLDGNGHADVLTATETQVGVMKPCAQIGTYMMENGAMAALGYSFQEINEILADRENPWRIGSFVSVIALKNYVDGRLTELGLI